MSRSHKSAVQASLDEHAEVLDREVSIGDIIRRLWKKRGILFVVPLLALLLGAITVGLMTWNDNRPIVYYVLLQGINNEQYPNGTRFAPQDLVGAQILEKVGSEFGIASDKLMENVRVTYDNPSSEGVSRKYRDRLSARNLTQADIDTLNSAYQKELLDSTRQGMRIEVNNSALGVGRDIGAAIAIAVPRVWKEIYTQRYRIFLDTTLQSAGVTMSKEALDSTASVLVASGRLRSMQNGLRIISMDNRLASLATENGLSAEDLSEELDRFKVIYFNVLFSTAVTGSDVVSKRYVIERELQIADLGRQIADMDAQLADIQKFQKTTEVGGGQASQAPDGLQVTDTGLGQIVALAERASFAGYAQTVMKQRQELVTQASGLRQEIARVATGDDKSTIGNMREVAAADFANLTESYQQLLSLARERSVDRAGVLYVGLGTPVAIGSMDSVKSVLILGIFGLIGLFLAIAFILVEPVIRSDRTQD